MKVEPAPNHRNGTAPDVANLAPALDSAVPMAPPSISSEKGSSTTVPKMDIHAYLT